MISKILAEQEEYKSELRKRLLLLDLNRVRALYFDISKGTIVWIQHPRKGDSSNFCSLSEIEPDEL